VTVSCCNLSVPKTPTRSDVSGHPHLDHLFKVGVLYDRSSHTEYSRAVRSEAADELLRYRDDGLCIQNYKKGRRLGTAMTRSGFCAFESPGSHATCKTSTCTCECHDEQKAFSGRGILFAVIDDREQMREGKTTTIDIIADAIEAALDADCGDSESIARYLTTSAFQHISDKRVRFNSVLKAGDTVGAQIVRKLYNSYNELAEMAEKMGVASEKAAAKAEVRGFAAAIQIIMNPFSAEDAKNPQLVNWDEVDNMTDIFETEQRVVRADRKKNPR